MRQIWHTGEWSEEVMGGVDRAQQSINKSSLDVSNVSPLDHCMAANPFTVALTWFDLCSNQERISDILLCQPSSQMS